MAAEATEPVIALRPATMADARMLWDWANDPESLAASFTGEPIAWESHLRWLEAKLTSGAASIYIAECAGQGPVGTVRFDLDKTATEAVISVNLDATRRRKGLGSAVIRQGCRRVFADGPARTIHAYIKRENIGSLRAFENAGFERGGDATIRERPALHYVMRSQQADEGARDG